MTNKEVIVPADDLVCIGKDKLQELIRCKDCIFRKDKYCQLYIMEQHEVEDNDYCSEAERKEK